MKKLLALCFLLLGGWAFAGPPKLTVLPTGELQIVTGGTTLTVKSDGSVLVKSAAIDLTIPGTDGPTPPTPPGPTPPPKPEDLDNDPLAKSIRSVWGALGSGSQLGYVQTLAGNLQKTVDSLDSANSRKDLITLLVSNQTLKGGEIRPIRDVIGNEMNALLGPDLEQPLDKPKVKAFFQKVITILKELK